MAEDLKTKVHDFWQANPCGAKFARAEVGSRQFFEDLERHRYATEWHIPQIVKFGDWRGREVLEIGCGLGTDAVQFARAGARYTGIDLTERAVELVTQRFEHEGLRGQLQVADAENLPFENSSFDLVYSHGVLHHTPNIEAAVGELRRVLRPGGTAIVMLYHRASYNYRVNIMLLRRLGVRLLRFRRGPELVSKLTGEDTARLRKLQSLYLRNPGRLLDRNEFLNQNTDGAGNPLARVFTRAEAASLFSAFESVHLSTHFLNKRWIPLVGRIIPRAIERALAKRFGWHLWIVAKK